MAHHYRGTLKGHPILVTGALGLLLETDGSSGIWSFTPDEGRIKAIDVIRNPRKLKLPPGAVRARLSS